MAGFDNPMRDVGSEETIRQIAQVHYEDHDHDDASDDDDDDDNDDHDHDDESDDDDDDEDERKVSRLPLVCNYYLAFPVKTVSKVSSLG